MASQKKEVPSAEKTTDPQAAFGEPVTEPLVSDRRQKLFDHIHRLSNAGLSGRKITKVLDIGRNTVRYYLAMESLQSKGIVFTNNYEDYLDEIRQGCEKGLNMRDIFRSITGLGFRGKLTAFYHWFHNSFPGYDSKYKRNELQAAPNMAF